MSRKPTIVDLYCGAGGLALGFKGAGFDVLAARDVHPAAVETYRASVGAHVRQESLTADSDLPDADVYIGGPPCQGFSSAGMRRQGDARNTHVSTFAALVVRHRPMAFVFENVEGFLTGEDGARVFDLLDPLLAAGYRVHLRKVNAANYGVAQHRKRVIAVGGLGWDPSFPRPTHAAHGAPGATLVGRGLPKTPTAMEALGGLPPPDRAPPGAPPGHFAPAVSAKDQERLAALGPGQTMRDLPPELWHATYARRANRRVSDGTPSERRGGAPSGIRRLRGDEPSKAITSMSRSEFVHPTEHRFLTLRECARLQGFSDDFSFRGSQSEIAMLIGNAVPPRFAGAIAQQLLADLLRAEPCRHPEGRLLSFVPTHSTGMSPALAKITSEVEARFMASNLSRSSANEQLRLWA